MAFNFVEKLNKAQLVKKFALTSMAVFMLLGASCGSHTGINKEETKTPGGFLVGTADSEVEFVFTNEENEDYIYFVPSEESIGNEKVSSIKLLASGATSIAQQASYKTFLDLKNQKDQQNNSSSNKVPSNNTVMVTPNSKLNSLIRNNKYSSSSVTVIQSGKNPLSEDTAALMKAIKSNSKCSASFLAIRISDGASIGYNVDKQWRCMSTFKAPTALYAYKLMSEGKLSFSDKMTYTSKYYYPGSGVIRKASYGTKYTIKTLVSYSILHSDNVAYVMLRDKLNANGIAQMCKEMGCTNYADAVNDWPKVSARDAALWWNEIYNFSSTNQYGNALFSTFVNATGNVIDRALGYEYQVAHKSGSGSGYHHDCAIVMADEPYILVLYTYNKSGASSNYTYMSKIIQEINKIMVG